VLYLETYELYMTGLVLGYNVLSWFWHACVVPRIQRTPQDTKSSHHRLSHVHKVGLSMASIVGGHPQGRVLMMSSFDQRLERTTGRTNEKVAPLPGPSLSAQILPPIASTSAREMASPRPEPPPARERDFSTL
jgi:hypothetical protein